jgi:PKD repeat protein
MKGEDMKFASTFASLWRGCGIQSAEPDGRETRFQCGYRRRWGPVLPVLLSLALCAGIPAGAAAAQKEKLRVAKPFPQMVLGKRVRGEEAVQALKDRLPEVAAWYGMTPTEFARLLRHDRHAWLNRDGRLLFVDDFPTPPQQADGVTGGSTVAAAALAPLDQTFFLHSRPGAKRVIHLDFDGALVINTAWNNTNGLSTIDAKPYDLDGSPATFSSVELERIQYIWQRVAEDYAPFDVDVTTEEPLPDAITRSGSGDLEFGTRVVIARDWTRLTASPCNCGGFAYVGAFDDASDTYKPAWVFFDNLGNGNEKYVAEAISHEAGHNLGLGHDGNSSTAYYGGHGAGATGWAPIMGVGYYRELTQWSMGEYPNANQTQDDLQRIQIYGAPLRLDDHIDANATPLDAVENSGVKNLSGSGVIGSRNDVDVFSFYSGAGTLSLDVVPGLRGPNLDISAVLYDAQGNLLALSNPVDALSASITKSGVPPGTYYLAIDGVGKGDLVSGYSDYASLGQYFITGSVPSAYGVPPIAVASATPATGTAPLIVSFDGSGSYDPDGGLISYDWDFGDGSAHSSAVNPSHSYAAGNHTAVLTVTDAAGSTGQVQVNVTVQAGSAPVVHIDNIAMSLTSTNARARVTVTDAAGQAVAGATVSGRWSGVVSKNVSGVTNSTGNKTFSSPSSTKPGMYTFTVTGVSVAGYTYDASQNKETSDSVTR